MGCGGASLNGWPGTQETLRFSAAEMPVQQLGLSFVGIEQTLYVNTKESQS